NYRAADIDASFYALIIPDHPLTLGSVYNPTDILEFRIQNSRRTQLKTALTNGHENPLFTQLTLKITPPQLSNL
ncbi:TonB-dependent receptor, partial [Pseudoalteromonas sp. S3785]